MYCLILHFLINGEVFNYGEGYSKCGNKIFSVSYANVFWGSKPDGLNSDRLWK
jgi:hypothetical protein